MSPWFSRAGPPAHAVPVSSSVRSTDTVRRPSSGVLTAHPGGGETLPDLEGPFDDQSEDGDEDRSCDHLRRGGEVEARGDDPAESPPPASAARVAVATSWTAAIRTPVRMSGRASGTSTRTSSCRPVIPMLRAARTTSRSTSRIPTYALVSSGGTAKSTRATTVGPSPYLPIGVSSSSTRTAKVERPGRRWRC